MVINYELEAQKLASFKPSEGSLYWKPQQGTYRAVATSELDDAPDYIEEGKEPKPMVEIKLDIDGETKAWSFGKGKSPASTYGQFIRVAQENGGKLTDCKLLIVVNNDGKRNSYTIIKQ